MKINKLLALVICGAMMLSSVGCGKTNVKNKDGNNSQNGVVELKIPSYKTGENVGAVFFEPQVKRFNEKYTGKYKITLETVPQDNFSDRLKQLAQQKALPVLVQGGDPDWIKNVVIPNGLAYDLGPWINETPAIKDVLIEDSLKYCTVGGKVYVMPMATVRSIGMFYNSSMWKSEKDINTLTVDEFMTELGDQKIAFSTAENGWVAGLMYTALIANQDGGKELLASGAQNKIVDLNKPAFVNAAAQLQKMLQKNAASNSIGATYPDAANAFMSKQASIIANGPWMAAEFEEKNSANWSNGFNGADIRASFYPGGIGIANTSTYGEWWVSASASEKELECAKAFLEFIYSPNELEAFMLAEGGEAPNLKYSDSFKEKQSKSQILFDLAEDATSNATFVPCFLDIVPNSVANSDFGRLLPSLADGTYTPEKFCEMLSKAAAEATA